jgi:predicted permease
VRYAFVFGNCGYMGLPFLQSLFGGQYLGEVLIYGAVVIAVFNIMCWTIGIYMITGDKKNMSLKKIALNPTIIGVVLGFIVFVIAKVPIVNIATAGSTLDSVLEKLAQSLNFLGDMVTPLAMMVIGIRLANVNLKQLFMDKWAYITSAVKLVVMPMVVIFCVSYLPIASTIKYTVFFLLAMPSATSGVMMAVKFGKDSDFASTCVLLSTILCIVTLPPLYLFMNGVLKIPM